MGMAIAMIVVMGEGEIVGGVINELQGEFGYTDTINRRLYYQNSFWGINFGYVLHCRARTDAINRHQYHPIQSGAMRSSCLLVQTR
jgi:hypothetical protein